MAIDGIRSVLRFEGIVRQAVHQLKYRNVKALALPLAALMDDYLRRHPLPATVVVPVPLHPHRLRERGYNQSLLLARELGRLGSLPLADKTLLRVKNTPPQARARSSHERQRNTAGAFSCRNRLLKGKRVLLVDDVCTSGATLNACAHALKEVGAESVWGLTLARESPVIRSG